MLVTPGDLYGPSGAGFIRLSYAGDDGRVREGLTRMANFVETLRTERTVSTVPRAETVLAEKPVAKFASHDEPLVA